MRVTGISQSPTFQGKYRNGRYGIRELWMSGKIPEVTHGIYGTKLTKENCTREHIVPRSLGGSSDNSNIALADKSINNRRGTSKLSIFTTLDNVIKYLKQFLGIKVVEYNKVKFDGDEYVHSTFKSLKHEGIRVTEDMLKKPD